MLSNLPPNHFNPAEFQALLCDVDQTITTSTNQVTETTQLALRQISSQPTWTVAVCTGRGYPMLLQEGILDAFPDSTPHICCGGALVITKAGEVIWHRGLAAEVTTPVLKLAAAKPIGLVVKTARKMYGTSSAIQHYQQVTTRYQNILEPLPTDQLDWDQDPIMSMVAVDPQPELNELLQNLPVTTKPMNHYFGHSIVDITAAGITKAEGLTAWCQHLGINPAQTIGVGDSGNDLEFLSQVGYAVAMGNALPEVKAIADLVINSNDQDGLAEFITTHLLGDAS